MSSAAQIEVMKARVHDSQIAMSRYETEIQKKFALAAACIVFVLLGAPIGIRFPRGGVGLVIGVSIAVFALYYVGLIVGEDLADKLILDPVVAMWMANALFTVVGVAGLIRVQRVGGSARGGDSSELFDSIRAWVAQRCAPHRRARGSPPASDCVKLPFLRPLDRYVASEFIKIFITTALGFPLLVIVIDLTDRLGKYLNRHLTPEQIAMAYVYWFPESIYMVLPAAVLFATVFTIGSLTRHSELTAAKASGISFYRLLVPIFGGAAVVDAVRLRARRARADHGSQAQ